MRVALDGMLLQRSQSGVEFSILNLAHALARHGSAEYRLYIPRASECDLPENGRLVSIPSGRAATSRIWRILWEQFYLPSAIERDKCQLLHAPGYLAPLHCKRPVVLTVYDLMALSHPNWCRPSNRINYRLLLPRSIKRADVIIVPSLFTKSELLSRFPSAEDKVRVVPLAVSDDLRQTPTQADLARVRNTYNLPTDFVLFVGQREPKKNLDGLVNAFHLLKSRDHVPQKLVIAGALGWGQDGLTAHIRGLGLQDDILFPGFVAQDDLAALYHMTDLFVFPSLYEGFGLPPLEAMHCGVPVVCSHAGSLPEVVGSAAVLVDPLDAESVARGMRDALQNQSLREKLISKGRIQSRKTSWSDIVVSHENIYRSLLTPSQSNAGQQAE